MATLLAVLAAALALGGMAFFSFVMAPLVFRQLDREQAAAFMRAAFPRYYAVMGMLSLIAALTAAPGDTAASALMAAVAAAFAGLRAFLLPALNRHREGRAAGDEAASRAFARLHGFSMAVNFAQLAAVTVAVLRLAS